MKPVVITVGPLRFTARFEHAKAPQTCAAFAARLPFEGDLIQARWSGESAWSPLGDLQLGVPVENATSHPSRGDILFYQAAVSESETEIESIDSSPPGASRRSCFRMEAPTLPARSGSSPETTC